MDKIARPMITTSVKISPVFWEACKTHRIKFVDAMRAGISILLAEKGVADYDNKLNLFRRMKQWQDKAEELMKKAEN